MKTCKFDMNINQVYQKRRPGGLFGKIFKVVSRYKRPIRQARIESVLIKENVKTVLVRIEGKVVKRHKIKHRVEV